MTLQHECSISGLHLNWKSSNTLIENISFYLNKVCSNLLVSTVSENSLDKKQQQ